MSSVDAPEDEAATTETDELRSGLLAADLDADQGVQAEADGHHEDDDGAGGAGERGEERDQVVGGRDERIEEREHEGALQRRVRETGA